MNNKTRSIFSLKRYIIIFLLIAFVVSCSFFLFLGSMNFTKEEIQANAILTFLNVMFLSLIFCLIDGVQRKISTWICNSHGCRREKWLSCRSGYPCRWRKYQWKGFFETLKNFMQSSPDINVLKHPWYPVFLF